jgi:hypothetical protein
MKSYMFLKIKSERNSNGIYIECTNVDAILWIVSKIQKIIPGCNITRRQHMPYLLEIDKLKDKDIEIRWLVFRWLTEDCWEPFGIIGNQLGHDTFYYFRKEISNN